MIIFTNVSYTIFVKKEMLCFQKLSEKIKLSQNSLKIGFLLQLIRCYTYYNQNIRKRPIQIPFWFSVSVPHLHILFLFYKVFFVDIQAFVILHASDANGCWVAFDVQFNSGAVFRQRFFKNLFVFGYG